MDHAIRDLADRIRELLPDGPELPHGFHDNLHALIQGMLARSDLVTREEFDAQQAVLQRTRARLEALEDSVSRLEAAMRSDSH